jgi:hypothetical protein
MNHARINHGMNMGVATYYDLSLVMIGENLNSHGPFKLRQHFEFTKVQEMLPHAPYDQHLCFMVWTYSAMHPKHVYMCWSTGGCEPVTNHALKVDV